ncbi:IPT/TIG domain-containing protein [Algoriphagus aquimarinus]|uniref:IPT/TIG domain-containing protein n=1 Tax=Algoriphagus aquimarinus TaxID=237018 RepID=UPI0030DCBF24|tara:strand:+ start:82020 stop:84071 length:2052 start_codon:yes stop_codon:yes gene_type:complete
MKKNWIVLIALVVVFSCNENDEVVPRTNPRFSVAYIQEVTSTGAEFSANVYDFGSDEILEYGFVYSKDFEPRVGAGEVIKSEGRPQSTFKLVGDHSMVKGQIYYVVAFIKTSQSIVYSQTVNFKSQGSEGFIIDKLVGGPEVYFGDTLTVYGSRFSTDEANYEVLVNNGKANIVDINNDSFKIIIPEELGFGYPYDYDGKIIVKISILDKTLEINTDIKFYDPIFYESDKEFRYEESFYIKGKYLRDGNMSLSYPNYNIEIVSNSDTLIVFKPFAYFETLQPAFQVYLRGKGYEVKNSIKIMRTEILPGQTVKSASIFSNLIIKGTNFNSVNPFSNFFVSDVEGQQFDVNYNVTPNEIKVYVQSNAVPNPRFFKVWAFNAGVKSTNYVTVENTDPSLSYMYTHNFPFTAAKPGRSVTWSDKGIWLVDGKITEVDPEKKTGRILKTVDLNQGSIASSFAVIHEDKIYFAGENEVIANTPGRFYSYDLVTGILTELPKIPSKASTPKALFVSGGYLYFGGGYYKDEIDIQKVVEGYKFNLTTKTWSTWDKKFPSLDVWNFETTFTYQGDVYGLVNEVVNSDFRATRLMRFDSASEDWVELAKYPFLGIANGNVVMPIGDFAYVFMGSVLQSINMQSYSRKVVPGVTVKGNHYGQPPYIFTSKDKIYTSSYFENVMYQVDPSYFQN